MPALPLLLGSFSILQRIDNRLLNLQHGNRKNKHLRLSQLAVSGALNPHCVYRLVGITPN